MEDLIMKSLIFSQDIFDGDTLVWCAVKEYRVTFENSDEFYVASEVSKDTYSVKKENEGSLYEILTLE